MTRDQMEAKVRQNFAAWNRHDAAAVAELMAPDATLHDNARELRGREEIQAMAQGYFDAFPDLQLELISLYVDGRTVLQEWRTAGTHGGELMGIPATGRRVETAGAGVDEFGDDGLVHRGALYWDTAKLLQDIGVLPSAATTPA
jgi:steroid delta-isomerase-like uncharacterized protein